MSLDELAEADEEGRVKSVPVSDVGLEKIVEVGLAMKSFEIDEDDGVIKINKGGMDFFGIKVGDKMLLKSMIIDKDMMVVVVGELSDEVGELMIGLNKSMIDTLAIYQDGYVFMRRVGRG